MRPFDETIEEMKRAGLAYDLREMAEDMQRISETARGSNMEANRMTEWPGNLVTNLRMAKMAAPTFAKEWCIQAADEIERLTKQNKRLLHEAEEFRQYVHWASGEIERKQKKIVELEAGRAEFC
jgi:dsDNA-specific endonuclease/ATPase MutS2